MQAPFLHSSFMVHPGPLPLGPLRPRGCHSVLGTLGQQAACCSLQLAAGCPRAPPARCVWHCRVSRLPACCPKPVPLPPASSLQTGVPVHRCEELGWGESQSPHEPWTRQGGCMGLVGDVQRGLSEHLSPRSRLSLQGLWTFAWPAWAVLGQTLEFRCGLRTGVGQSRFASFLAGTRSSTQHGHLPMGPALTGPSLCAGGGGFRCRGLQVESSHGEKAVTPQLLRPLLVTELGTRDTAPASGRPGCSYAPVSPSGTTGRGLLGCHQPLHRLDVLTG